MYRAGRAGWRGQMWALVFGMDRHEDGGGGGDDRDEEDEDGRAGAAHAAGAQVGGCLELDCAGAGAAWWWWWVVVVRTRESGGGVTGASFSSTIHPYPLNHPQIPRGGDG